MELIENKLEFDQLLSENEMVMVYFSRLWCGVCHAMKPQVEKVMEKYPAIKLKEINIDQTPEFSGQLTVFSVPAMLLFYEGKEIMRQAGYLNLGQLMNFLDRLLDSQNTYNEREL